MARTVLAVDDNKTYLETFQRLFTFKGYDILTALNPNNALDIIKKAGGSIDLLLTDLDMPELSGDRLMEEAHRIEPDIKYILHTARTKEVVQPILERLKAASVDVVYLHKPTGLNDMVSTVESLIGAPT